MQLTFQRMKSRLRSTPTSTIYVYRNRAKLGRLFSVDGGTQWILDGYLERRLFQIQMDKNVYIPDLNAATHRCQAAEDYRESIQSRIQFRRDEDSCRSVPTNRNSTIGYISKNYTVIFDALEIGKIHTTAAHRHKQIGPTPIRGPYNSAWMFDEDLSRFLKFPYWKSLVHEEHHNLALEACKHLVRVRLHGPKIKKEKTRYDSLREFVHDLLTRKAKEITQFADKHPPNVPHNVN